MQTHPPYKISDLNKNFGSARASISGLFLILNRSTVNSNEFLARNEKGLCVLSAQADKQKQQKLKQIYEVRGTVKLRREKRCAGRGLAQDFTKALTKR